MEKILQMYKTPKVYTKTNFLLVQDFFLPTGSKVKHIFLSCFEGGTHFSPSLSTR